LVIEIGEAHGLAGASRAAKEAEEQR
jgi:hypothetical protein